jgi:hypothetical protein
VQENNYLNFGPRENDCIHASTHLSLKTRKNFAKSYVWSVLLYGSETWTLTAQDKKKIEAMEMWTWRKFLRISWAERKSNEETLQIV